MADASITPATFLPLCDFQATLVLSQSQAQGGLAWYNVPASATATPTVHQIGPFPLVVGTAITSNDIRSDPNYIDGGLIGFALMKDLGNGPVPVYYSEDMRNVDCTGCTTPGYWKMALSYRSTIDANSYYMAWEDWEGADANSWQGNDGDFNDKVFEFSGVTCEGSGVPCQTGMPGVCANGVTQCQPGGTIECIPRSSRAPRCATTWTTTATDRSTTAAVSAQGATSACRASASPPCSDSEFPCSPPLVCMEGLCVDTTCLGVTCQTGQICHAGNCVGGCDGVTCPLGQECELGVCVDPCAGGLLPGRGLRAGRLPDQLHVPGLLQRPGVRRQRRLRRRRLRNADLRGRAGLPRRQLRRRLRGRRSAPAAPTATTETATPRRRRERVV